MGDLDLDAARAARAEARGEPPTVTLGGETFTLPPEMPLRYVWTLVDGDDMAALRVLFNGQLDRFLATEPTREDILTLIAGVPALYGLVSPGESPASAGSSNDGSSRSRPTSPAATRSTSAKRSTARRRSG
jgi:hypothetical protein